MPPAPQRPAARDGQDTQARRIKPVVEETKERDAVVEKSSGIGAALALPVGTRLSLAIIDGPGEGTVFRLTKPTVTIGRSGADLIIEDTEASRLHASIEVRDTAYQLKDLDSKNGTMVDGTKIEEPVQLQDKSEFVIGSTTFMLIVTQE